MALALDPYQEEGVQMLLERKRFILADEMGLGKTIQAIEAANRIHDKTREARVLIVTKKSLVNQWGNELMTWGRYLPSIQVITTQSEIDPDYVWSITNYETVVKRVDELRNLFDVLIVDEAQYIKNRYNPSNKKNPGPQRTKAIWEIAKHPEFVWLLTASPMRNKPAELWSLLHCLDPKEFRSYWRYVQEYLRTWNNGFGIEVGGVKNSKKKAFGALLDRWLLRREKVILDLPPVSFENVLVGMTNRQARL